MTDSSRLTLFLPLPRKTIPYSVMVLQSFRQYRSFANSDHVKRYGANYGRDKMFTRTSRPEVNSTDRDSFVTAESSWKTSLNTRRRSRTPGETNDRRVAPTQPKVTLKTSNVKEDDSDPFLIDWEIDEQDNPMNWSWKKKWSLIAMVASIATLVGAGSAIDAAAIDKGANHFGVSTEVMSLQVSLFLIGSGIAAPLLGCELHFLL